MDKLRVVVCGTTFGRIYAAGIRRLPAHYELVAMLSRGSEQSYEFASEQGVPLCTRIEDLHRSLRQTLDEWRPARLGRLRV